MNQQQHETSQGYSQGTNSATAEIRQLNLLKQSITSTLNSVQEIENSIIQKSSGISEDARRAILDDVKSKIDEAKHTIQTSFEQHSNLINNTLDQLLQRVEELKHCGVTNDGVIDNSGDQASGAQRQKSRKKIFSQKVFIERSSLLSFENSNDQGFRTLENIFIAFLILLGIYICIEEYFERGTFFPDLQMFFWVFSKSDITVTALMIMYSIALMIVPFIQLVKNNHISHLVYIPIYTAVQILVLAVGVCTSFVYQLPPASAMIVTAEMARVCMKIHAYFREKTVNGLNKDGQVALFIPEWAKKQGVKTEDIDQPTITIESIQIEFKRFAYFFFCPSLVYRDSYVRSRRFRMNNFLKGVGTFLILIFYLWSVFKALCIPIFRHTAENPGDFRQFLASVIFSTISGIICMLTLFYGILHTWLNMWSEMLRFGDRQFYEDWWNVTDFEGYYRKWNIVVHEFLYYYIFQDSIRFSKGAISRQGGKYMAFLISALFHEVIVTCGLGFFFPILFIMFGGPGVILTKVRFGKGVYAGTFFWFLMLIGSGMLMVLICREFYARQSPEAATFMKDGLLAVLYPQSIRFMIERKQ